MKQLRLIVQLRVFLCWLPPSSVVLAGPGDYSHLLSEPLSSPTDAHVMPSRKLAQCAFVRSAARTVSDRLLTKPDLIWSKGD